MRYIKTDNKDLMRDPRTGAIININDIEYRLKKEQRKNVASAKKLQDDVNDLKNEFSELKDMLKQLINRN